MKLYYFKDPHGNFGDDLNPWLWSQLLPNFFNDNDSDLFVGIGTLLNHRIPAAKQTIVFGSGVGYGDDPHLNAGWDIVCVRGPLSAKALKLPSEKSITDPAVLAATLITNEPVKTYKKSFMPHCLSARLGDWENICDMLGIHYIDPRWNYLDVFNHIQQTETLYTEAMHGAILADAFRTPWVPIKCYDFISDFKWQDWQESVGLNGRFNHVDPIWVGERDASFKDKFKIKLKRQLLGIHLWNDRWEKPYPAQSSSIKMETSASQLEIIMNTASPLLSEDSVLHNRIDQLLTKLEYVKTHYAK